MGEGIVMMMITEITENCILYACLFECLFERSE